MKEYEKIFLKKIREEEEEQEKEQKEFGHLIKQARARAGDTLQDLSNKIGISPNFISMVETGKRKPSLRFLTKISKIYNIQPISEYEQAEIKKRLTNDMINLLEKGKDDECYINLANFLFKESGILARKNILNYMLIQRENEAFKNGTYENFKEQFDKIKKIIDDI